MKNWWIRNWRWLLACGIAALIGVVVLIWRLFKKSDAEEMAIQLAVFKGAAKVAGLEKEKEALQEQYGESKVIQSTIDREIDIVRKKTVKKLEDRKDVTAEEAAEYFRSWGY